jgi:hypothetical protein
MHLFRLEVADGTFELSTDSWKNSTWPKVMWIHVKYLEICEYICGSQEAHNCYLPLPPPSLRSKKEQLGHLRVATQALAATAVLAAQR